MFYRGGPPLSPCTDFDTLGSRADHDRIRTAYSHDLMSDDARPILP